MKKNIMESFSLRDVILEDVDFKEDVLLKIRCKRPYGLCPHCASRTNKLHSRKVRKKLHSISGKTKVYLLCTVRRFYCKKCRKPFTEYLPPWMNGKYRYTKFFENLISEALVSKSFFDVARTYGTSTPTLLSILKRRAQKVEIPVGDLILNVDEHSYRGRDLKTGIAEINNKKFLAILDDDNQITLENYFNSWPEEAKSRVLEVCIDMKSSYLTVLKKIFPKAKIVVDHFHVVKEMNRQVDDLRKLLQQVGMIGKRKVNRFLLIKGKEHLTCDEKKRLEKVFKSYKKFPTLKYAYFVKEKVREMYASPNRKEAERRLDLLLSQLDYYEVGKLKEMRDTLIRWKPYILNYFESKTTNAFIEGCHNKIKLIKRMSYGFRNFGNYVLKITLGLMPFLFQILHNKV